MRISPKYVFTSMVISYVIVLIFLVILSYNQREVARQAVAESNAIERPCSQTQEEYLAKAAHYLARNDQNGVNGDRNTALSALTWMEYYKICSEFPRAQ